jgi:hypothetical protein
MFGSRVERQRFRLVLLVVATLAAWVAAPADPTFATPSSCEMDLRAGAAIRPRPFTETTRAMLIDTPVRVQPQPRSQPEQTGARSQRRLAAVS